jgi:hypothetical protein
MSLLSGTRVVLVFDSQCFDTAVYQYIHAHDTRFDMMHACPRVTRSVLSLHPSIYAQGECFLMRRNCNCNCAPVYLSAMYALACLGMYNTCMDTYVSYTHAQTCMRTCIYRHVSYSLYLHAPVVSE